MMPRTYEGNQPYPKFPKDFKVYIEGHCFRQGTIMMFARAGCKSAESIEDADLVVFLGGEDIDPELYGEKPHKHTSFNPRRDAREVAVFDKCIELKKPMFGICRGMQFIHAKSGGKLHQHVVGHAGRPHDIIDLESGDTLRATSLHHQMCVENEKCIPLAYAVPGTTQSAVYEGHGYAVHDPKHKDLEAAVYLEQRAIGVQGHPEIDGESPYVKWCLNRVLDLLFELKMMDEGTAPLSKKERMEQRKKFAA